MNLQPGDQFSNVYMPKHNFRVLEIDENNNVVRVRIIPINPDHSFEQDWNLQHTIWAFESKEYHSLIPYGRPYAC